MTDYNDGKWHGWDVGECPVHPESRIDALWIEDGQSFSVINARAGDQDWFGCFDAFRVVKEHREPGEWWIADNAACKTKTEAEMLTLSGSVIHVREVIE